jgi:thiamine-phosphate pyrophosphorylase
MRGLYAIADMTTLTARGVEAVAFVRAVAQTGPAAIQLRAKDLSAREYLSLLGVLGPICRDAGVPLVANDRVDVAAVAGCDFVHVGQGDLPLAAARRLAPHLRVGISTHDLTQLAHALAERPDYVAYGPVYPTASKAAPDPVVGIAGLRAAYLLSRAAGVPLVAIGGITLARAREIAETADAGAVIADLLPGQRGERVEVGQVTARAERLHAALLGGADGTRAGRAVGG